MIDNRFLIIFVILVVFFTFNINSYEIVDSKTVFYDQEINLNLLDLNENSDHLKVILSVINFDDDKVYFEKELSSSKQDLDNFTFSKLYNPRLLFKYDFYDQNSQLLFQKIYQIDLIENPKDFKIFICNSEKQKDCVPSSRLSYKDSIYVFSSNSSIVDYNVSVFDLEGNLQKEYSLVSLPLKLDFDYLGIYKIKVEANNISKTQFLEITNQKENPEYLLDISNKDGVESLEPMANNALKNKNNLFLFLKIILIIILLVLIYSFLFKIKEKENRREKRKNKKLLVILIIILFISFSFITPLHSYEIEYNDLEISYQDLQTKFEYPKEISLLVYPGISSQKKIIPIVDFDQIYSGELNLNESYEIEDKNFKNSTLDLDISLIDVYLIADKKIQQQLKLDNLKTYQECYNVINFYNNNPIQSRADLVNRTFFGLINDNHFSEGCVSDLVNSNILVPKKLLVEINYSDSSFDYNKNKTFDLKFNISHIFWNAESKKIKLNLIYTDKLDLQMKVTNNLKDIIFNLENNGVNISSKGQFPKETDTINYLKNDILSLQNLSLSNDFNFFEFEIINGDIVKFSDFYSRAVNIENRGVNYNLRSISKMIETDNKNNFLIDYYLINGNLSKSKSTYFSRNRSKLRVKSAKENITFYNNDDGLYVKDDFGYEKIYPDNYNLNIYYYYKVYPDYIDFYVINYDVENIIIYNDVFSYTFFNSLLTLDSDLNITNISSNEFGRSITIDNKYTFNSELFIPNLDSYYLIDEDYVLKEKSNLQSFYDQDQNLLFESILNKQYSFFKEDFEELKRKIIISTDVSNAYDFDRKQTNLFIAYYLSKIEDSFDSPSKVHDFFCKQDSYEKYSGYFKNANFSYFKYNFLDSIDVYGNNPFIIEKDFNKVDYERFCQYLINKPNQETIDFTTAIFLGADYLQQEKVSVKFLDSVLVNSSYSHIFTKKELYLFVSNYLLFNNILQDENLSYAYELKKIYNNSFLDFKIPNYNYEKKTIKEIIESKYLNNSKYVGNCAQLSVDSLNYLFNYKDKYNVADAWYLVGNNNISVWRKDADRPLNISHLIPGVVLGIHTSGNNYYEYKNFIKPNNYDLPNFYLNQGYYSYSGHKIKVPYTHVVSYLGDVGDDRGVVLNAGSSNIYSLLISDYVPRGKDEGNWIVRTIVEVLVPSNYYSEEEIKNLKTYLTSFD